MLGKRRLGQAINDSIKTRLDQSYDYVYAMLKDERIAIWSSAAGTVIPDAVAPHVAALMAFEALSDIGASQAHLQRIVLKEEKALGSIFEDRPKLSTKDLAVPNWQTITLSDLAAPPLLTLLRAVVIPIVSPASTELLTSTSVNTSCIIPS